MNAAAAKADERLNVRLPAQPRAHATLERIVAAAHRLLREKSFEEITVAEIVRDAETSTGSFYARFGSKEALLPYLYEKYNASQEARAGLDRPSPGATPMEIARALVKRVMSGLDDMRWLLRAMANYARQHPERLPPSSAERNRVIYQTAIAHFAPLTKKLDKKNAEVRARFLTYAVVTVAREHELFGQAPMAAALGLDRDTFERELARMAAAYLASE